ncbi:MAG: hypothetical protein HWE13_15530 [Gammaproteobacteria bacterium]|nr:hypothetical protein [Gammaproteobacteria bacterium]NVK89548.1 hypothetical protein [Gammaproteobacteria bacterium]
MGVPSEQELAHALTVAAQLREQDQDFDGLGKCLLNQHYQLQLAQKVVLAAKHYLRSGQGTREHSQLVKAIEQVEQHALNSTDSLNRRPL